MIQRISSNNVNHYQLYYHQRSTGRGSEFGQRNGIGWSTSTMAKWWQYLIIIHLMMNHFTIESKQIYCDFNRLCLCQNYTSQYMDVTCVNVPLDSMPELSHYQHLYRVRIIGARLLTQLYPGSFQNLITLASLAITNSRLFYVNPDTFRDSAIRHTLTTLDLSYGSLLEMPIQALVHLHQLQWLSLKGNQIEMIKHKEMAELSSLRTLLLNENLLFILEDKSFQKFTNLELINFDDNMIERVEGNPFPSTIRSLYISNCLLRKIPFDSIQNLPKLEILQLRGNLISHLSPFKLAVNKIQLIDLSHNLISLIPNDLFANFDRINIDNVSLNNNGQYGQQQESYHEPLLKIEQFYLDFNFIQSLSSDLFRSVLIEKLSITNNRISSELISPNAFQGPTANGLKVLDLNYNLIDNYPTALKKLKSLRHLLLKNNRINKIDADSFNNCALTLEVLDLSQNLIEQIPRMALNGLKNLIRLNLHDNLITKIYKNDFTGGLCSKLKSLTISKNNLDYLEWETFETCTKLTELRLGGNKLLQISPYSLAKWLNKLQLLDLSSLNSVVWMSQANYDGNNDDGNKNQTAEQRLVPLFTNVKWVQLDFNFLKIIPNKLMELFPNIKHLDLQNNFINNVTDELKLATNLTSIILSNNNLTTISSHSFSGLSFLESITLYFNRIEKIQTRSFEYLPRLQSLVLSKNQINYIEPNAFYNLSNYSNSLAVMLDGNNLRCLSVNTFQYISGQQPEFSLYLNASHNQIKTFANCQMNNGIDRNENDVRNDVDGDDEVDEEDDDEYDEHLLSAVEFKINNNANHEYSMANYNGTMGQIVRAASNQLGQTLAIRVLDISHNQIVKLTSHFLFGFCTKTLSLLANNNLIRSLPIYLFTVCAQLQTLSLNHNLITNVYHGNVKRRQKNILSIINNDYRPFNNGQLNLISIQTLGLHHNLIKDLNSFSLIFKNAPNLKTLHLNHNQLELIPANLFYQTSIVNLNLAHNRLKLDEPVDECFGIKATLKYLDISFNLLSTIPKRLLFCQNLIELIISNNRIHTFKFITPLCHVLTHLQRLELNDNPIQFDAYNENTNLQFLNNNSMLSILNLNNLNIFQLEEFNIPYLHTLDLSKNNITNINSRLLSRSRNVRILNLAENQLHEVPKHIWKYITRLQNLNLRNNPIDILDSSSFAGLKHLRYLDIRGLNLQYIDSRIFIYQSQMLSLKISTYPQIRSFRLQDILSKSDSIKTILVDVKERFLSHQIQWAFGGKLRELIITGKNLATIVPDAFQGLNNANDLILRITNTSIESLPDGLLRYLADIRYITIDLRNNYLQTISPTVFFNVDWKENLAKTWQSRQLLGGIKLENNPLNCDCNLLWISQWMREIFTEMKSINVEAAIHAKSTLSLSRCQLLSCKNNDEQMKTNQTNKTAVSTKKFISIIDLRMDDICEECYFNKATILQIHIHRLIMPIVVHLLTFQIQYFII